MDTRLTVSTPNFSKLLFFLRHCEAEHNEQNNNTIPDPPLTLRGQTQAQQVRLMFRQHEILQDQELVVISPLRRTLETANCVFQKTADDGATTSRPAFFSMQTDLSAREVLDGNACNY
jgi:broad specificity phosphatase PhoE